MINYFSDKAWIVTYEYRYGFGCIDYGILGIFNKSREAEECKKDFLESAKDDLSKYEVKIQKVKLKGKQSLFDYLY